MTVVQGTYQRGAIVLEHPLDLPDGATVNVALSDSESTTLESSSDGRPWPLTPEGIEALIAEIDAIPALEISKEEYAKMEAERLARKVEGAAETKMRMDRIASMFD